jgi:hypothetical protein
MLKKRNIHVFIGICAAGVLLGGAALGVILWRIHQSVRENRRVAQQAHPHSGDDVAALIDFMNSPSHSLWERTHVGVWTLGRLRDPKALPALESAYTGDYCDHDKNLCQYELEKAITLCGGAPIPTRKSGHESSDKRIHATR